MPVRYHEDLDRSYAWVILTVSVLLQFFEHIATTGIFYVAILEKYQQGK